MEFLELTFSRHDTCNLLCDTSLALARSSPTRRYTGIENFKGRKKYQSVALESSFRMIYCLLIFDDPVNLNVIYNSNIDTYLPVAPAIIKIKS